jgi:hypothetical protein
MVGYDKQTLPELRALAKEHCLTGYSKLNKADLVAALRGAKGECAKKSKSPARKSKSPKRKSKSPKRKSKSPKRKASKSRSKSPKKGRSKSPKKVCVGGTFKLSTGACVRPTKITAHKKARKDGRITYYIIFEYSKDGETKRASRIVSEENYKMYKSGKKSSRSKSRSKSPKRKASPKRKTSKSPAKKAKGKGKGKGKKASA